MERAEIEQKVRLSRIYKRRGLARLQYAIDVQLELERERRKEKSLPDLVTEIRSSPELP